jgi:hypothetical protein
MQGRQLMKTLFLLGLLAITPAAKAAVTGYVGAGAETLLVDTIGGKSYAKLSGVTSPWADKVIQLSKRDTPSGDRYSFNYEEELSSGKISKTYEMITGAGKTLIEGSLVPQISVFYPGRPEGGLKMHTDAKLSKDSQKVNLAEEYKKAPFTPDMD